MKFESNVGIYANSDEVHQKAKCALHALGYSLVPVICMQDMLNCRAVIFSSKKIVSHKISPSELHSILTKLHKLRIETILVMHTCIGVHAFAAYLQDTISPSENEGYSILLAENGFDGLHSEDNNPLLLASRTHRSITSRNWYTQFFQHELYFPNADPIPENAIFVGIDTGTQRIELTPTERIILTLLAQREGAMIPTQDLIAKVEFQKKRSFTLASLEAHICRLRIKLYKVASPKYVLTKQRGIGYSLRCTD